MVLVDAIFINNGGGKVLLNYLINTFEQSGLEIFYLLDSRLQSSLPQSLSPNFVSFKDGFLSRHQFYQKHRTAFSAVLCFGNIPPSIVLKCPVYTYFHQRLFIEIPVSLSLKEKISLKAKMKVLSVLSHNSTHFIVQSEMMKNGLKRRYALEADKILVLPFYPPLEMLKGIEREKNSFVYVSSAAKHKNQGHLIEAFCQFYQERKVGRLTLTIGNEFLNEVALIRRAKSAGIPIENIGYVNRDKLASVYCSAEYLLYPSLSESLGLGLLEAIELGCKVIGADLPYTYEVCKPSLVFDPMSIESIKAALETATTKNLPESIPLIRNNIQELIDLLTE